MPTGGPILRIFEVKAKPGCAQKLLKNFETTSVNVVKGKAGNLGYFFGDCVNGAEDVVMFVSIWINLDAVQRHFGKDWQESYLPDGYNDLIEECSIRHFDTTSGWHVNI